LPPSFALAGPSNVIFMARIVFSHDRVGPTTSLPFTIMRITARPGDAPWSKPFWDGDSSRLSDLIMCSVTDMT
jgi:hypothetical protein